MSLMCLNAEIFKYWKHNQKKKKRESELLKFLLNLCMYNFKTYPEFQMTLRLLIDDTGTEDTLTL